MGGIAEKATASRISWLLHFGEIPGGMEVCHKCDNPECTNPEHLFLGTHLDNCDDRMDKDRSLRALTPRECDAVRILQDRGVAKRLLARAFKVDRNSIETAYKHGTPEAARKPRIFRSENSTMPPLGIGVKNGNAKLGESDVLQIRALRAAGQSTADIAAQFAVGKSMVSHICTRRCWTHI